MPRSAVAATSADPRFPPSPGRARRNEIEISLLGPLEPIAGARDIVVGRDGLVVEASGRHRGLLLPQVATEWKWDAETFLDHTCQKAGLPRDAWHRGGGIWRFEAEVFGEMNRIVVFSGTAHLELAASICKRLKTRLSTAVISRFSNDCLGVQLKANCRQADVFIIQPLVPPVQDHLMELLLMLDAARGASAARITAVMPHYAYARSDKKDEPRISIAARLVADCSPRPAPTAC